MPTIVREDHDDLNVTLTVNIPKEDYEPTFKKKLKEYSKQANMKGFRKGQVPVGVVRKMFGKGALVEIINEMLGKELDAYIKEADFDILGQPIPVEHEDISLVTKDLKDYSFKFDIGLVPDFEVQGLEEDAFHRYDVEIPEKMVNDDLADALKRMGTKIQAEDELQEGDMIQLEAVELDGMTPKENGLTSTFMVSFDELTEDTVEDVFTKKNGDSFQFDITNLSKDKDEKFIRKYFLKLDEETDAAVTFGNKFEAKIVEVNRVKHAELNQEFFDGYFGPGNVTTEEEAKAKMKENIKRYYDNQANGLLFGEIVDKLKASNPLTFPDDFLARWIETTERVEEGKTATETVEGMKEGLQWSVIRSKLAAKFDLQVHPDEIKQNLRSQVLQYMGGYDYGSMIDDMVERMASNEEQVNQAYTQILSGKLFDELKKVITISEMPIETEEFEEILKAERAKNEPTIEEAATTSADIEEAEIVTTDNQEDIS